MSQISQNVVISNALFEVAISKVFFESNFENVFFQANNVLLFETAILKMYFLRDQY